MLVLKKMCHLLQKLNRMLDQIIYVFPDPFLIQGLGKYIYKT